MRLRHTIAAPFCAALLGAQALHAVTPPAQQTVIDSDSLEMTAGEEVNNFRFAGNVHAEGQGILLVCDKLDVIARRLSKNKATVGKMTSVQSIVAQGNVRIEQAGRVATSGRAEVLPDEGLVILSDNPRIVDSKAAIEGWKIIYNSKDRTVQVVPAPEDQLLPGQKKPRSRVTLSEQAVPKLDYEKVLGDEGNDNTPASGDKTANPPASGDKAK